eukprot:236466_1
MYTLQLSILFFSCILYLNGARKSNAVVTVHRKEIYSLFSEDEIWGIQHTNKTDIVRVEVVVEESKLKELPQHIPYDIVWADAEEATRQEMARINNRTIWGSSVLPDLFFLEYRDWTEYVVFMETLAYVRFPQFASLSYMGLTVEG